MSLVDTGSHVFTLMEGCSLELRLTILSLGCFLCLEGTGGILISYKGG